MTPEQIREARRTLALTQKQFGESLGAKPRTVQGWELGERKIQPATIKLLEILLADRKKEIEKTC